MHAVGHEPAVRRARCFPPHLGGLMGITQKMDNVAAMPRLEAKAVGCHAFPETKAVANREGFPVKRGYKHNQCSGGRTRAAQKPPNLE